MGHSNLRNDPFVLIHVTHLHGRLVVYRNRSSVFSASEDAEIAPVLTIKSFGPSAAQVENILQSNKFSIDFSTKKQLEKLHNDYRISTLT